MAFNFRRAASSGRPFRIIATAFFLTAVVMASVITADACTGLYVGKDASADGSIIIARCADTHPLTTSSYLKVTEDSETSGQEVRGQNGFVWTLPKATFRFVSSPRPVVIDKGEHWDSETINESGLAVTATVTAYANEAAIEADPYVADGISEDNIAEILGASCSNSREAMELLAQIIDEKGSAEANIVMAADQNEAWYMEIYTGHSYAAVKMPEDCVTLYGNQFMLEKLDEYSDVIMSEDITADTNVYTEFSGNATLKDYSNLRTWRGHQLMAPSTAGAYSSTTKYPAFYQPDEKVTTSQAIDIFRDRYEGYKTEAELAEGKTRVIGAEAASQVHVIKVHPVFPAEICCEEWYCDSNAAYAPFVPLSNITTSVSDAYGYILPAYEFDENSAAHVFKRLNTQTSLNREFYGLNIEAYWQEYESQWEEEYTELLRQAKSLCESGKSSQAAKLLTGYQNYVQAKAYSDAKRIYNDLDWFIMENTQTMTDEDAYSSYEKTEHAYSDGYMPQVDMADWAERYGWEITEETSEGDDDAAEDAASVKKYILTSEGNRVEIVPADVNRKSTGTLISGEDTIEMRTSTSDGRVYIPLVLAQKYLKTEGALKIDPAIYSGRSVDTAADETTTDGSFVSVLKNNLLTIATSLLSIVLGIMLLAKSGKKEQKNIATVTDVNTVEEKAKPEKEEAEENEEGHENHEVIAEEATDNDELLNSDRVIESVKITGVVKPAVNKAPRPGRIKTDLSDEAQKKIDVAWYELSSKGTINPDRRVTVFEAGKKYVLQMTITLNEGYSFKAAKENPKCWDTATTASIRGVKLAPLSPVDDIKMCHGEFSETGYALERKNRKYDAKTDGLVIALVTELPAETE